MSQRVYSELSVLQAIASEGVQGPQCSSALVSGDPAVNSRTLSEVRQRTHMDGHFQSLVESL